jgi:16S rRNA (cytidine1402-2'-O)-methyltransferase
MDKGKLYVVPTPIGNLKDITLRALEVLQNVDLIAAEDTRQSIKLLNHFNIKKRLISYHKHNEYGKSENLIDMLKEGKSIALVSDAGTPGISDPGSVIVSKCIENNIEFEVLTGATAITTALVYSGMDSSRFVFIGFLSRDSKERRVTINQLKDKTETIILYESPHRLSSTLEFLRCNLGNRKISICRELTKLHEEILRLSLEEAVQYYDNKVVKGEIVIVIEGKKQEEIISEQKAMWEELTVEDHIKKYISEGLDKKEAVKKVAKDRRLSKAEIYKYSIGL